MNYKIAEYPEIQVDQFGRDPSVAVYILTHAHSDHMCGLSSHLMDTPVYCSLITAQLLLSTVDDTNRKRWHHNLVQVAFNRPYLIKLKNDRCVQATFLPAHHCPGSAMILLQGDRGTVLCTGDFRAEESIKAHFAAIEGLKVDSLYLDTTFAHSNWAHLPSRLESANALVEMIKRLPTTVMVQLKSSTIGYEYLWIHLAQYFHTKIYVSKSRKEKYVLIDKCQRSEDDLFNQSKISLYLTTDERNARFFVDTCSTIVTAKKKHCLVHVLPSAMFWGLGSEGDATSHHTNWNIVAGLPDFVVQDSRDDMSFRLLYSMHSSLSELIAFVSTLKPSKVYPMVTSRTNPMFSYKQIMKHFEPLVGCIGQDDARYRHSDSSVCAGRKRGIDSLYLDQEESRSESRRDAAPEISTISNQKLNLDAIEHIRKIFLDSKHPHMIRLRCARY
ncbi:hypothetical protein BASA50_006544 [Batrachochytrium salamandrivorans]|uniref:Protein artemis n=1 Tax=Batrachochytrium salamandrivorans TaxID=1357716 RepID=A0ABQ8F9S2_9FUNG|nr:hypothetical protein BASA62_009216 [Batrachochytrium salamandrivorans]KAH6577225.1 hypothetical protein BASA60_004160 [Batrachochytrium salamandrivorans]KAH6594595.1 hypothetical protein BASA50_006544 [Batrachochytrium salamandrivorans]